MFPSCLVFSSYNSPALKALTKLYECYNEFIDLALFGYLESVNFLLLKQGKCMKQVQDVIERLWDFIDKLDINTFGKLVTTGHSEI